MIRSIAFAILLTGCGVLGISRDSAIEIAMTEANLTEVTEVNTEQQQHANPNGGGQRTVWVVTIHGITDRCVPGGGGCRDREAIGTYYIDVNTGEIVDGLMELRG